MDNSAKNLWRTFSERDKAFDVSFDRTTDDKMLDDVCSLVDEDGNSSLSIPNRSLSSSTSSLFSSQFPSLILHTKTPWES